MNDLPSLKEKQAITKDLLADEMKVLELGFNPITNKQVAPEEIDPNIPTERTSFNDPLDLAFRSQNREKNTMKDINSVLTYVKKAATRVIVDRVPISTVQIGKIKKRDIQAIFDYLSRKRNWTNNSYNFYRSYLMMVFKELSEFDAVESNIPRELSKKQVMKTQRVVLTPDQRKDVKEKIIKKSHRFWLFTIMFFHSGARITEFCRLKVSEEGIGMPIQTT